MDKPVTIARPYLLFLGDAHDDLAAKTAIGIVEWRREWCMGQMRLPGCVPDLGLPELDLEAARDRGAQTLIVGVANRGGVMPDAWIDSLVRALALGFDVASGLHRRLADIPAVREAAERHGKRLFDVRHPSQSFEVASGEKRPGLRLLTVGTDCSVGKMYTSLALERALKERGAKADFRATGQTGILIAGAGVSVDAVVADFIAGATEWLSPASEPDHWDLIEGQGSLFHPSYAGVSLGLLHGAQPDAIVLCHEPTRRHMRGLPDRQLPGLAECLALNLACARLTNPDVRCVGIAVNTRALEDGSARKLLVATEERMGLATVDPVRTGVAPIVERLLAIGA